MKTVRNNPCRPRRVYIEIVFTLLCKHLLQDGTLKCEQNSTSPLLDAAVLLGSDKQLEWGAVLCACSSCCHGLLPSPAPALPPPNLGIVSAFPPPPPPVLPPPRAVFQTLSKPWFAQGCSDFPTLCSSRCQVCEHAPRSWVVMMFWLRWRLQDVVSKINTALLCSSAPHFIFFQVQAFSCPLQNCFQSLSMCVCDLQWVIS